MTITTRTAPRNARMIRPSPSHLAAVDNLLTQLAVRGLQPVMSTSSAEGSPSQPDPPPDLPNTPPDTATRLDAQDAQLANHEDRLAALEERSPPPSGLNDGAGQSPADAHAAVSRATLVDGRAIYARHNARSAGPNAAAIPPMPEMIQTSTGPMLDAGAINARHNAFATARAGRPHARVRG